MTGMLFYVKNLYVNKNSFNPVINMSLFIYDMTVVIVISRFYIWKIRNLNSQIPKESSLKT